MSVSAGKHPQERREEVFCGKKTKQLSSTVCTECERVVGKNRAFRQLRHPISRPSRRSELVLWGSLRERAVRSVRSAFDL